MHMYGDFDPFTRYKGEELDTNFQVGKLRGDELIANLLEKIRNNPGKASGLGLLTMFVTHQLGGFIYMQM